MVPLLICCVANETGGNMGPFSLFPECRGVTGTDFGGRIGESEALALESDEDKGGNILPFVFADMFGRGGRIEEDCAKALNYRDVGVLDLPGSVGTKLPSVIAL